MGELISAQCFRVAQTSVEERCGRLRAQIFALRHRALQHVTTARNMEYENPQWALHEKQAAHLAMAQVAVYMRQLENLHMQAAFFRARRTPRLCEVRLARFVPPWVVWHLPEPQVEFLVHLCENMYVPRLANETDSTYQMRRIAKGHELVAREIELHAAPSHKPTKFVTKGDVEFVRSFARKMLDSKPSVDAAYDRFMASRAAPETLIEASAQ